VRIPAATRVRKEGKKRTQTTAKLAVKKNECIQKGRWNEKRCSTRHCEKKEINPEKKRIFKQKVAWRKLRKKKEAEHLKGKNNKEREEKWSEFLRSCWYEKGKHRGRGNDE